MFGMAHNGSSNYQVELIDAATGDTAAFLANEIGVWEAYYPTYVDPGEYVLDVNADGDWIIRIEQPRPPESAASPPTGSANGEYPNYVGPIQFDGLTRFTGRYQGDSNFAVWVLNQHGQEVDLLFNEIGSFEGETTFSGNGVGYVRVEATGPWEIEMN